MSDTIFALSSGPLPAGVAVLRISGPDARAAAESLAGPLAHPRQAVVRDFRRGGESEVLDRGLVLWFPGPASFTGEDVVELQVHGSPAVVAALLAELGSLPNLRLAEAGEFSRRAFLNGKMDLAEAEGLADLLAAQTESQRRQAMRQLQGALSTHVAAWRQELVNQMAAVASALDFADEGDVSDSVLGDVEREAKVLGSEIGKVLETSRRGEIIRDGATVLLAGPPNAGKSSLLNAMARRDVALVSPHAGTTRDTIEVLLDLDGLPVVLIDTAGLRATEDPVERMGIERTLRRAASADLVIWLSDRAEPPPPDLQAAVLVYSKSDLRSAGQQGPDGWISVSCQAGIGIDTLLSRFGQMLKDRVQGLEPALVTQERHRLCLVRAVEALRAIDHGLEPELVAEQLRLASRALDAVVGRIDVEEVLGAVFSRFCIGK